jgi:hypothetical protein
MLGTSSTPALAECTGQVNRWPSFSVVAPSARRIVVGEVRGNLHGYVISPWFDFRVTHALRGGATGLTGVRRLRSGLPLVGSGACRGAAVLYARQGDVIAIAYGGRLPGKADRVTAVAWIEGKPTRLVPGGERLTLAAVRRLAELPRTDAIAAQAGGRRSGGSSASLSLLGILVLGGFAAVAAWLRARVGQSG